MNPTETLPKPALQSGGRMLIGGDWRESQSGKRFATTPMSLREFAIGGGVELDRKAGIQRIAHRSLRQLITTLAPNYGRQGRGKAAGLALPSRSSATTPKM